MRALKKESEELKFKEPSTNSVASTTEETKKEEVKPNNSDKFSWIRYLNACITKTKTLCKTAPHKLWAEPFPLFKNPFKAGMKIEGIDPQHQSLFCVMTIVDVVGHRIRLHFDGYSEVNDFWCNANSPNIFQPGWCEKNGRKLETPPGIANFTWKAYAEHCKATLAPKSLSSFTKNTVVLPSNFRIGMKLEAEDRKNGWTCVATVVDTLENRVLVHFDGWDNAFDTWFDTNSPFLHPVGWCTENGVYLFPPKDYHNQDNFNWQAYIQETNSVAVPARAFKPRFPKDFKVGMKLEAVDKRNPMLVRVATVAEVKDYKICIHFDGWSEDYNLWMDDDSSDIHPATWCYKTNHPLEPPLTPEQCAETVDSGLSCGTPGCKSVGHVKGLIYSTHHTAYGCPYSMQNINKDWEALLPDRLDEEMTTFSTFDSKRKSKFKSMIINLDPSKPIPIELEDESQIKRVRKRRKFFDEITPSESGQKPAKIQRTCSEDLRQPLENNNNSNENLSGTSNDFSSSLFNKKILRDDEKIDSLVHQSVFNPFYHPKPPVPKPLLLDKHKHLTAIKMVNKSDLVKWTSKDVKQFISSVTGCNTTAKKFSDNKFDGKALVMLTQQDIVNILGVKLGPAIKIGASIVTLKNM